MCASPPGWQNGDSLTGTSFWEVAESKIWWVGWLVKIKNCIAMSPKHWLSHCSVTGPAHVCGVFLFCVFLFTNLHAPPRAVQLDCMDSVLPGWFNPFAPFLMSQQERTQMQTHGKQNLSSKWRFIYRTAKQKLNWEILKLTHKETQHTTMREDATQYWVRRGRGHKYTEG